MNRSVEELVKDELLRNLFTEHELRRVAANPDKAALLIEDEIFRSDSWAIQAVNVVANSYPKQIVIVSAEARNELQQFPSIIADAAGTTQRYAGVEQLGAPSRRAREHYITTNFATDNIIIYLFRAKSHFPRAGISAWIHGYDTLNYIFNWMNEVAVAVDNSSA